MCLGLRILISAWLSKLLYQKDEGLKVSGSLVSSLSGFQIRELAVRKCIPHRSHFPSN